MPRTPLSLVALVITVASLLGLAGPAQAGAIAKPRTRYNASIEPLAAYQAQTVCSPRAKAGVWDFSTRLLRRYPTTRSLGIVRACSAGDRSEHKEGRAFDWAVSASDAGDRQRVARVMKWLLKTDRHGNRFAMARRLGIQYMIWNRKIWGSYAADSGWRKYSGASSHSDHVHFSFTWAGARGRTSFWTGKPGKIKGVPPAPPVSTPVPTLPAPPTTPAPVPTPTIPKPTTTPIPKPTKPTVPPGRPEPQPLPALLAADAALEDETVFVHAALGSVVTTGAVQAGVRYLVEASGTWAYGPGPNQRADAECSTTDADPVWRRDRSVHASASWADHLDLYVDGTDLWSDPDVSDGTGCDSRTNTYRETFTATRTGRLPIELWDPTDLSDNSGGLSVRVIALNPKDTMQWQVPASAGAGVTSVGALEKDVTYLLTVTGTVDAGNGVTSDAECSVSTEDPVWRKTRSVLPEAPTVDHLDVLLDGRSVTMRPTTDVDKDGCSDDQTYRTAVKVSEARAINVRVNDPAWSDNNGVLDVRVERVDAPTGTESLRLDTSGADVVSARNYLAGVPLLITATGTYDIEDGTTADAECSATLADPVWRSLRSTLYAAGSYLGDVTVDGRTPSWKTAAGTACDAETHSYTYSYTPSYTGPVTFGVADTDRTDNSGTIALTITPAGG